MAITNYERGAAPEGLPKAFSPQSHASESRIGR